jgi:ER-derived vesicles protein
MAQIRGTAGYNLGLNNNQFGGQRNSSATNDPSPLDQIKDASSKIEDYLNALGEPLRP